MALSGSALAGYSPTYNTGSERVSDSHFVPAYGGDAGTPGPFGPYFWTYSYTRSFDGTRLTKNVEINFNFDPALNWGENEMAAYRSTVEANIEGIWNNRFSVMDTATGKAFPVTVDVTTQGPFDQNVFVHAGGGRADMLNWFSQDSAAVNAHEFGHMLGLYDEYLGGAVDQYPNPTLSSDGLMGSGTLIPNPVLYPRYYQQYLDYMRTLNPDHSFALVAFGQVPEPSVLALLAFGVMLLPLGSRRSRQGPAKLAVC